MFRRLLRVGSAVAVIALTAPRAEAMFSCPSNISNGNIACHLVSGSDCANCTYWCPNGTFAWNMCQF